MPELILPAKVESLEQFQQFVASCAGNHGFSNERADEMVIAVEEALVNVFNYAYPEEDGEVQVRCWVDESDRFVLEISDSGNAFNILEVPDPNLSDSITERPVGGLGIFLIRQLMEEVNYRRENDRNVLTFTNGIK